MTKTGSWAVSFDITLDGQDIDFDKLSDETQEYITDLIKAGYYCGEIVEEE